MFTIWICRFFADLSHVIMAKADEWWKMRFGEKIRALWNKPLSLFIPLSVSLTLFHLFHSYFALLFTVLSNNNLLKTLYETVGDLKPREQS